MKYEKLSKIDHDRHDAEVKEFKDKGYFVDKNGVKSSDLQNRKADLKTQQKLENPKGEVQAIQPKNIKRAYTFFFMEWMQ